MNYHKTHQTEFLEEGGLAAPLVAFTLCMQVEKALFRSEPENFHVKTTKEPEEIQALLIVGFEFVIYL